MAGGDEPGSEVRGFVAVELDRVELESIGDCQNIFEHFVDEEADADDPVGRGERVDGVNGGGFGVEIADARGVKIQSNAVRSGFDAGFDVLGRANATNFDSKINHFFQVVRTGVSIGPSLLDDRSAGCR